MAWVDPMAREMAYSQALAGLGGGPGAGGGDDPVLLTAPGPIAAAS